MFLRTWWTGTRSTSLMISPSGLTQYTSTQASGAHDWSGVREKELELSVPADSSWPRLITCRQGEYITNDISINSLYILHQREGYSITWHIILMHFMHLTTHTLKSRIALSCRPKWEERDEHVLCVQ